MQVVDIILALLLTYFTLRGYFKGLLRTLAYLASPVIGFVAAVRWAPTAAALAAGFFEVPDKLHRTVEVPALAAAQAASAEPHTVLSLLAFPVVFLLAVIAVRLLAHLVSVALGLSDSMTSRLLGAVVGGAMAALLFGTSILLLNGMVPEHTPEADGPRAAMAARVYGVVGALNRSVEDSILGPRLAAFAGFFVSAAIEFRDRGQVEEARLGERDAVRDS